MKISLSACGEEHMSLSTSRIEVIPLTILLQDLSVAYNVVTATPEVTYRVLEGYPSCIALPESKKPLERNNYIAIKLHHFRNLVDKNVVKTNYIDTKKQLDGILLKPIDNNQSFKLRFMLMSWQ